MYYDIIKAEYVNDYKIKIVFADGASGVADLKHIIEKGRVFRELKDQNKFRQFFIHKELKVIAWKNEIDIAPESLYKLAVGEKITT